MKNDTLHRLRALSALVAATVVAACGGGSDAPPPPVAGPPPAPATATISGKALYGRLLQGATACYDTNANRACDAGEPATAAASDANGAFTLDVPNAQVGQHRIVVNVPATAVDTELGQAVGTAFTMLAPATGTTAAHSVAVSPLSTLVQQHMDRIGAARDVAGTYIQSQAGLAVSPLADFSAAANAENQKASNVGKLVVLTGQQQAAALTPAVGQTDLSGGTVTQADLAKVVSTAVAAALPALGAAAAAPAVAAATGAALQTALATAANAAVQQIGLTVPEVVANVGQAKLPVAPAGGGAGASASLRVLQYTNAQNWFIRSLQSSAADSTPDANNLQRYIDVRTRMAPYAFDPGNGVAESFGFGGSLASSGDLHWTGSAWAACTLGQRNTSSVRDAQGRSSYNYCDGYERGTSTLSTQDVAGQTLTSVLTDRIRSYPGGSNGVLFSQWGPSNLSLLGGGTLPAGSLIRYTSGTVLDTASAYDVRSSNQVQVFSAVVAAGGDARSSSPACAGTTPSVVTNGLEEMVARMPGQPCIFGAQTNADGTSTNPRYGWGATSLSLGVLANGNTLPAGTGNYYSTNARLRVTFAASGNATTYHSCYERRVDSATQNCSVIGTGTYSIATLGDARVMSFANLPAQVEGLTFRRVFVERGGRVYHGYKNKVGQEFNNLSLNLPAANAYLGVLGLPVILPVDAPQALTGAKATNAAALAGVWSFDDAFGAGILRFGPNGEYLQATTNAPSGADRPGLEYGWMDIDASGKLGRVVAVDSGGANGLSHFGPAATFSISATTLSVTDPAGTESVNRFPDSGTGLVGVWAVGSATDLKATHFAFFPSGKVLAIHPAETEGACATARQGPPGIEAAPYTFNATTGALSIGPRTLDTSGCTGLWDIGNPAGALFTSTVTIAAGGASASFTLPEGGSVTLYRVAPR